MLIHQDEQLVRTAARGASIADARILLEGKSTFPAVEEILLQEAAKTGNGEIVRYILRENPKTILSEDVRYYAVIGGIAVWKELVSFDPNIVNVEIGHHGDAVGLAVGRKNVPLLTFLLNETGVDIEQSNYAGLPVLPFAIQQKRGREIIDLLTSHGARMKDEVAS